MDAFVYGQCASDGEFFLASRMVTSIRFWTGLRKGVEVERG